MTIHEIRAEEALEILQQCISMELRVKSSEVGRTVGRMQEYGFQLKNSWASMELKDHTIIEFWKKELLKGT
ncbi:hypothetical protein ACP26L_19250 [Paenibacillus sp. S-38]|uniref:hypothetical protein n=1 Tax=Paenibacillus sp. S-38 TaxID=3416710 RepID=UPI003CE9A3D1